MPLQYVKQNKKIFILIFIFLTLGKYSNGATTIQKFRRISQLMNDSMLVAKDLSLIEESAHFIEDKNLVKPVKSRKKFFTNDLLKVKTTLHTLLLTYAGKVITSISYNQETNKYTINGQEFSFSKSKSISQQTKALFTPSKKISSFNFFIENAVADTSSESRNDVKRFIVFSILMNSSKKIENLFTDNRENTTVHIELTKFSGADSSQVTAVCDPRQVVRGTATIEIKGQKDKILIPFESSFNDTQFKTDFSINKTQFSFHIKTTDDEQFKRAACYHDYLSTEKDTEDNIVYVRNYCRKICDDSEDTAVKNSDMCLKCTNEENRADIDFLYDTVTSAFESGTYFSPNISTCFMDDRINWLEEKKEKSLTDYKKCLVNICRGNLKTFFPTFESMFNNIDLNQLIETNLAITLPKHKEFLEAFHELKKRVDSIKNFPKDQCINKYFDCNISSEVITAHQLDQVYSKYKSLREPIKEKLIEIKNSFDNAQELIQARVACCYDKECESTFQKKLEQKESTGTP